MSASPWLSSSSANLSPNASNSQDIDPWATIDSEYLHPTSSSSSSNQQQQLRARRSSPSFPAGASTGSAQVVDRHPLRSPSPGQGVPGPSNLARPEAAPRRPSAVASEWKAISAGLAGLFGGSSNAASSSTYKWPADPATSNTSKKAARQSATYAGSRTPPSYLDDDDDETRKGRPANTVESTLDRLEDWFGLRQQQQQSSSFSTSTSAARTAATNQSRRGASSANANTDEEVRVLIHPVAPTDTLSSLALHYGADIQVLRKSNKLWPGDPVQIRKVIYIPVDSCKHRPPNAEIKVLPSRGGAVSSENASTLAFVPKAEEEDLLTGTPTAEIPQPNLMADSLASMRVSDPVNDFMPDTNKAYTDSTPAFGTSLTRSGSITNAKSPYPSSLAPALRNLNQTQPSFQASNGANSSVGGGSRAPSVAASASAASSGFVPPRQPLHVAKIPADQLRFFANDAKSSTSLSGSKKAGPGDADFRPGDSGIDDLLAMAANPHPNDTASGPLRPVEPSVAPGRLDLIRNNSSSNISGIEDEDEEWKPNTWHFGSGANKPKSQQRGPPTEGFASANSDMAFSADAMDGSMGHYTGWNDAPAPHAIVAKAYDGGKAHQRRQAQKSHRLLYDLAAGLPANTGAASKWARPIQFGDSLPSGPPSANGTSSLAIPGGAPGRKSNSKGGFGKLLDDTIRGRISVEAALEGALEGVRAKTSPLPQVAPPRSSAHRPQAGQNLAPPPPRQQPAASPPLSRQGAGPAPVTIIDPLSSHSMLRSSSSGLEQRRNRVDWTKGKDD